MFIKRLIDNIINEKYVYIQPHNFPDHDAVASAFGLHYILKLNKIKSIIVYDGDIQRDSLKQMIKSLNIDIQPVSECNMVKTDKIIIVDGCKWNKNVTDLIGDEICVIDHHQVDKPEDVAFADIRSDYGACSSIIYSYFTELSITPTVEVATALLIGINMDTALLTRGVSQNDIDSYSHLYLTANNRLVNTILRNYIQVKDITFFREAIDSIKIHENLGYCYFKDGCNQNLLGIIGDFILSIQEIDFVALFANNHGRINVSFRNESDNWNASRIIQRVLEGIGFGGGHVDMAGGIINNSELFNEDEIITKLKNELNI